MSARCCTGAALGKEHSPGCAQPQFVEAGSVLDQDAHGAWERQQEREAGYRAERARNLREQRRYEIARDIFVERACESLRGGWTMDQIRGLVKPRPALDIADIFLDELAKQPEPEQ